MKTNTIIAHLTVIALIVVAALSAHQTQAAPARKQPLTIIQPDGSTLTIRLHGDEWCHWTTDLEGNLLVTDDKGFYHIANATEMAAWEVEKAGLLEKRARINAKRYERLKRSRRVQAADSIAADSTSNDSIAADSTVVYDPDSLVCDSILPSHFSFPSKGKIRGLVVLVEFQDVRFTIDDPLQEFTDMMNKDGYDRAAFQGSKYKHNGSAHDYFYENSMGLFDPQFDVYGPILLKDSVEYYGKNNDAKAWQMITEACAYLDDSLNIDFSIYDNDSNDVIDFVYAIYAGYGENATSNKSDIWPHAWDILTAGDKVYKFDDKMLNDYACSNELIGPYLDGVGTFCHEFTHVLGLPDLYATNNAAVCSPLEYDLLDYGCYNRNGYCPSGYSSYERYELGWLTPTVLSEQKTDTLMELSTSNQAFIVPVTEGLDDPRDGEYYLFENRQLTDWDAYIPGHGMMVWHIDYQEAKWWSNTPNNWINHQCIDLVEADGQKKQSGSYVQDDSTPFPGSAEITAFTDDTTPAFSGWTSTGKNDKTLTKRLGKPISSIQEIPYVDETGAELGPDLITFDFRTEPPAAIEAITLDPIETMPQTNKVYVDGRLMIRTENGTFDMMGRRK